MIMATWGGQRRASLVSPKSGLGAAVGVVVALLVLVGTAGVTVASQAVPETDVTVALDWYPNANHAGLFLGEADGAFAAVGLDVDLYTPADPSAVLQTVGAGQDTFGISYQTDVLLARAQGVPVVAIAALVQRPLLGIMSLQENEISRPRDLVGRTVGYPGIPSQEAFLATMLEADGAMLNDVELVNVGFDLVPAVASGRVDAVMGAYWTHETILAEREGFDVDLMRVEDWGVPAYYELVMVASETTVRDEPAMVRAFLGAVQSGYRSAIANPEAGLAALMAASPEVEQDVEEAGLSLLLPVWSAGDDPFGTQRAERWQEYAAWMAERGLIPSTLDATAAFTTELLPGATATPVPTAAGADQAVL